MGEGKGKAFDGVYLDLSIPDHLSPTELGSISVTNTRQAL